MSAPENVLTNLNLFVDGRGYAGQIVTVDPPKMTLLLEEFRGGGMNAPINLTMGHEALTMGFELINFSPDILALWSVAEGFDLSFNIRGNMQNVDGTHTGIKWECRGKISELDPQTVTPGASAKLKGTTQLVYYKLTHGTRVVTEIDVINMVQIIDGVDILQQVRDNLGF